MDEKWNPESIKHLLDYSLARLDGPTLARLRVARMTALHCHQPRHAILPLFASAGNHAIWHTPSRHARIYYWIAAALLAASIFGGFAFWQQTVDDDSDVDIAILTDDLPIQYFLD